MILRFNFLAFEDEKEGKKAIKLVLNIYHFMFKEWKDLAHSHISSFNANCLDLFSPFFELLVCC